MVNTRSTNYQPLQLSITIADMPEPQSQSNSDLSSPRFSPPPPFDGKMENWSDFKFLFSAYCFRMDLSPLVQCPNDSHDDDKEKQLFYALVAACGHHQNNRALLILKRQFDDPSQKSTKIGTCAWKNLLDHYEAKDATSVHSILTSLMSLRQNSGDLLGYLTEHDRLVKRLSDSKINLPEEMLSTLLLAGLSNAYDSYKDHIKHIGLPTYHDIKDKVLLLQPPSATHGVFYTKRKPHKVCTHCGAKGHTKENCWKLHPHKKKIYEEEKKKRILAEDQKKKDEKKDEKKVTFSSNFMCLSPTTLTDEWLIDSGSTLHLVKEKGDGTVHYGSPESIMTIGGPIVVEAIVKNRTIFTGVSLNKAYLLKSAPVNILSEHLLLKHCKFVEEENENKYFHLKNGILHAKRKQGLWYATNYQPSVIMHMTNENEDEDDFDFGYNQILPCTNENEKANENQKETNQKENTKEKANEKEKETTQKENKKETENENEKEPNQKENEKETNQKENEKEKEDIECDLLLHYQNGHLPYNGKCNICKMEKVTFNWIHPYSNKPAQKVNERWHNDLITMDDKTYLISVDEFSSYTVIQMLKSKDKANMITSFHKLRSFIEHGDTSTHEKIINLRSDSERAFTSITDELIALKFYPERSIPGHHQQNGLVERKIKTLKEMTKCFLHHIPSHLKTYSGFCHYALLHATYITNNSNTKRAGVSKIPIEIYMPGTKRDLDKPAFCEPLQVASLAKPYTALYLTEDEFSKGSVVYCLQTKTIRNVSLKDTKRLGLNSKALLNQLHVNYFLEADEWTQSRNKELHTLEKNECWTIIDPSEVPAHAQILSGRWVDTIKRDGSRKSRFVGKGYLQNLGSDERYSPVIDKNSNLMLLAIAVTCDYVVGTLDIAQAFIQAPLSNPMFIIPPEGYEKGEGRILKVSKALYGFQQSCRTFGLHLEHILVSKMGLIKNICDPCLYYSPDIYVTTHVDDLLIVSTSEVIMRGFADKLAGLLCHSGLNVLTQGDPIDHLGMVLHLDQQGISMSMEHYIQTKLTCPEFLSSSKNHKIPYGEGAWCTKESDEDELKQSQILLGKLTYLASVGRPDLYLHVNLCASNLPLSHKALISTAKYALNKKDIKLRFNKTSQKSQLTFKVFSDASYGNEKNAKSRSGFFILLNDKLVKWNSKRQSTVATSSCEAEIIALYDAIKSTQVLLNILKGMQFSDIDVVLYTDSESAIKCLQSGSYKSMKHMEIKYFYIVEMLVQSNISLEWVNTHSNVADMLTKILPSEKFIRYRNQYMTPDLPEENSYYVTHDPVHCKYQSDSWEMNESEFAKIDARFKFTYDACASPENAKLCRYSTNIFAVNSLDGERVYCNPPYTHIEAVIEHLLTVKCDLLAFLVPRWKQAQWYQKLLKTFEIESIYLRGTKLFTLEGKSPPLRWDAVLLVHQNKS